MADSHELGERPISEKLELLVNDAVDVARKAKRHRKSLLGDNFYGNKLADLRADGANAFRSLSPSKLGGAEAAVQLIDAVFAAETSLEIRVKAARDLRHSLRTEWQLTETPTEDDGLFPLNLLSQAKRGYLVTVGRQMNGCFSSGWYDAAAVMMRRLVEAAILEAFEAKGIAAQIKDGSNNYKQLTDLVTCTLKEPSFNISRVLKTSLPKLRDVGHISAHGRHFTAQKSDLEKIKFDCRVSIEELLRHAGLL